MDQSIFIVRDTVFGQEFGPKLVAALFGVALAAWDATTRRRLDYVWVYLAGTLIWGGAEFALQFTGIRQMPSHLLFGHELAPVVAQLVQGAAEGATMAVMGIFVADRWLSRSQRSAAYVAFVFAAAALFLSSFRGHHSGAAVGSRRDVLELSSLLFIALLLGVSLVAAWRRSWCRRRLSTMFVVMAALGAVWTVSQVLVGGRWVEVGDATTGEFQRAGPVLTTVVLGLDVVFEIAVVYLPFLAVPILLGLIRDADPTLPRLPGRRPPRTLTASSNERPAP